MVRLLTILTIILATFMLIQAPWIAALMYATVSILQPQYVWFWSFDNIAIFKISAGLTIVAWGIYAFSGKLQWQIYNNGIFKGILFLLALYYVSDFFSPFQSQGASVSSEQVMGIYFTIVLMFFIVLGLIDKEKALTGLVWVIIGVTLYYTYWANDHYLSNNWSQFFQGRLTGPTGSPYGDGNALSIILVIGMPFVLLSVFQLEKKWQKLVLIIAIPLIWHALILFASRGAFLAAGVSTLIASRMLHSKILNVILLVGFAAFMVDQGSTLTSRTSSTVSAANSNQEEPLNPRLVSWGVGIDITLKHPFLGAGPQRFQQASRAYFPGRSPHVAHSTLFNFSSNLGIFAALTYLSFFFISWKMFRANKKALAKWPNKNLEFINKASICSIAGFFVGALFLDLIIFEPFYFLLLIIVANNFIIKNRKQEEVLIDDKA
jgi:hypothetical protein